MQGRPTILILPRLDVRADSYQCSDHGGIPVVQSRLMQGRKAT